VLVHTSRNLPVARQPAPRLACGDIRYALTGMSLPAENGRKYLNAQQKP